MKLFLLATLLAAAAVDGQNYGADGSAGACDMCARNGGSKPELRSITLRYTGTSAARITVNGLGSVMASPAGEVTIATGGVSFITTNDRHSGGGGGGSSTKLPTNTVINVGGALTTLHTSCSVAINVGQQVGNSLIITGFVNSLGSSTTFCPGPTLEPESAPACYASADQCPQAGPAPTCDVCMGGDGYGGTNPNVQRLSFAYTGPSGTVTVAGLGSTSVFAGGWLVIANDGVAFMAAGEQNRYSGTWSGSNLPANIWISGAITVQLHTSCSEPLIVGQQVGSALTITGFTTNFADETHASCAAAPAPMCNLCCYDDLSNCLAGAPGSCDVCGSGYDKCKPSSLTFRVVGGLASNPQPSKGAVSGSTISANAAYTVSCSNAFQTPVTNGVFTVSGFSGNDITCSLSDGSGTQQINFHVSCSAPLVTGVQWGAIVLDSFMDCNNQAPGPTCTGYPAPPCTKCCDMNPPTITTEVLNKVVECDGMGNTNDLLQWIESFSCSDDETGYTFDYTPRNPMLTGSGCNEAVTMTFMCVDDCNNGNNVTGTFRVIDTTDPVISRMPIDQTAECDGHGNTHEIANWLATHAGMTATDACAGECGSGQGYTLGGPTANAPPTPPPSSYIYELNSGGNAGQGYGGSGAAETYQTPGSGSDYTTYVPPPSATFPAPNPPPPTMSNTNTGVPAWYTGSTEPIEGDHCTCYRGDNDQSVCANGQTYRNLCFAICNSPGGLGSLTWEYGGCQVSQSVYQARHACNSLQFTHSPAVPAFSPCSGSTAASCALCAPVSFTVTDPCQNSVTQQKTFRIVDSTPPTISDSSSPQVECDHTTQRTFDAWVQSKGGSRASDSCSDVTWTTIPANPTLGDACNQVVTVTFAAIDACGREARTTGHFSVSDTTPPMVTNEPISTYVECTDLNAGGLHNWLEDHGGMRVTDSCPNGQDCTTGPSGQNLANTDNSGCTQCNYPGGFANTPVCMDSNKQYSNMCYLWCHEGYVTDNSRISQGNCNFGAGQQTCTSEITWQPPQTGQGGPCAGNNGASCPTCVPVSFSAVDACGNVVTRNTQYVIQDTRPPNIIRLAERGQTNTRATLENDLQPWIDINGGAVAVDTCGGVEWSVKQVINTNEFTSNLVPQFVGSCPGRALYQFTATDDCGNDATTDAEFWLVDDDVPVITGGEDLVHPCDSTCGGFAAYWEFDANLALRDWIAGHSCKEATDCSAFTWSVVGVPDGPLCGKTGTVEYTVTDDFGNTASSTANYDFTTVPVPAAISYVAGQNYGAVVGQNYGAVVGQNYGADGSAGACDMCARNGGSKPELRSITLRYTGTSAARITVNGLGSVMASPAGEVTIATGGVSFITTNDRHSGGGGGGSSTKLPTNTVINVGGALTTLHTSCSVAINVGQQVGNSLIITGFVNSLGSSTTFCPGPTLEPESAPACYASADQCPQAGPAPTCDVCMGGDGYGGTNPNVQRLSFAYTGPSGTVTVAGLGSTSVFAGGWLVIANDGVAFMAAGEQNRYSGTWSGSNLPANIWISGAITVQLHTSCSEPLIVGQQVGSALTITGFTTNFADETHASCAVAPAPACNLCPQCEMPTVCGVQMPTRPPTIAPTPPPSAAAPTNPPTIPACQTVNVCAEYGARPNALTFRYTPSVTIITPNNQEGKARVEGSVSGPISIVCNKAIASPSQVQEGQAFTITPSGSRFGAETRCILTGFGSQMVTLHTSCSKALNTGDNFGSLNVIGFDGVTTPCFAAAPPPTPPTAPPVQGAPTPPPSVHYDRQETGADGVTKTPICPTVGGNDRIKKLTIKYNGKRDKDDYAREMSVIIKPVGTEFRQSVKLKVISKTSGLLQYGGMVIKKLVLDSNFDVFGQKADGALGSVMKFKVQGRVHQFQTNCKAQLHIGDQFGALEIVGAELV